MVQVNMRRMRASASCWLSEAAVGALTLGVSLAIAGGTARAEKPSADDTPAAIPADPTSKTVVVTAAHTAQSATLQVTSDHQVSVVTADQIARNPDNNAAEVLARLPGVALLPTTTGGSLGGTAFMIDDAGRGEGGFISVRGLGPDYTLNLINGANIAEGKPASRQVQLSLLPPLGYSRIEILKSATAAQEGDSIAGIVDFRDATAFEIGHPVATVSVRGESSEANSEFGVFRHPFNGGGLIQGEVAQVFDNFGVHAVGYYQRRDFSTSVFNENEGSWDFLRTLDGSDHTPVPGIAPTHNFIGEQLNAQLSYGSSIRYGGNASMDWRHENATLFLRGGYSVDDTRQNVIQRGPQATNQDAVQNGDGTFTTVEDHVVGTYWFETNPERAKLANAQFGGSTRLGSLHAEAMAFVSYGEDNRPNHLETAYKNFNLDPSFSLVPAYKGNPAYPVPNLSAAQNAELNNFADYVPQTDANFGSAGVVLTTARSAQVLAGGKVDLHLDTGWSFLPTVVFGAKYVDSRRRLTSRDYEFEGGDGLLPGQPATLDESPFTNGLATSPALGAQSGQFPYLTPLMSEAAINSYIRGLPLSLASAGYGGSWIGDPATVAYNRNANTQVGSERVAAGYVAAPLQFGSVQVTPGIRFEHTDISNTFWTQQFGDDGAPATGAFARNGTSYDEPLPSVFATYRPAPGVVYRAAYWRSYVRPSLFLLGGGQTVTPLGDNVFQVQEGNPDLKPVTSDNFDLAGEWIAPRLGLHASVSAYYKRLHHYLFDAGSSTSNDGTHFVDTSGSIQSSPTTITVRPQNGGSAEAYGVELSGEQRLLFLPSVLSSLVISANATLQDSGANLHLSGIRDNGPLQYAPNRLFNASLFYETSTARAGFSYRYSSRYLETYYTYSSNITGPNGAASPNIDISFYDQPIQRLDFSAQIDVTAHVQAGFSAQNILNDVSYYATRGKNSVLIPQIVQPGRAYFFTLTFKL